MGLLDAIRPKWKHSDADVRTAAVKEMDDPETLTQVIVKDPEWFVRHQALNRLRDLKPAQEWYAKLVRESRDEEIRRKTVKVLTDVPTLEWVAKNDQYRYVRDAAEHRLDEMKQNIWSENPDGGAQPAEASQ